MDETVIRHNSEAYEVDPFVKRVVTVKPEDVAVYRFNRRVSQEEFDAVTAKLEEKMGSIPFVLLSSDMDLTVLKQSSSSRPVHIA